MLIGANGVFVDPWLGGFEQLDTRAGMRGLPDSEVERDLHAGLLVVVRLRNLHVDGNALGMRLDVADVGDAIGTPQEAEELLGQTGITNPHAHHSHSL